MQTNKQTKTRIITVVNKNTPKQHVNESEIEANKRPGLKHTPLQVAPLQERFENTQATNKNIPTTLFTSVLLYKPDEYANSY